MSYSRTRAPEDVIAEPAQVQLETFLDQQRITLNVCLDGVSEQKARRSLISPKTTLLRLVQHATFVEEVWFGEALSFGTRRGSPSRS